MYPQSIGDLFLAPMSGDLAMTQFNNASDMDKAQLAQLQQQTQFAAQNQPLNLEHLALRNKTAQAELPGVEADSSLKQDKAGISRNTFDLQKRAAATKLWAGMSDDEHKQADNALAQALIDPSPQVRAAAQMLAQGKADFLMQRQKDQADLERARTVTGMNNASSRDIEQMRIDAGKYNKNAARGNQVRTVEEALLRAKSAKERHQILIDAAEVARQNGDQDAYENYSARAAVQRPQAEAEIQNTGPKPGGVAIDKLPGTPIPVVPPRSIAPQQSANPRGFQDGTERVRVMSPDGKVGTIPRNQMGQAIQQGFKEVK